MLNKIFKLKENKTNVTTEIIAGITTFMAMSYIIFVNPSILASAGMDYNSVYVATILASMIGTLIMGLVANVPYVQSAGLGLNALFTYTICGTLGFSWEEALAMVFICGILNVFITITSVRNNGVANASDVVPMLAKFNTKEVVLALIGLGVTGVLVSKKSKNAYLKSIIITTIIGLFLRVSTLPDFSNYEFIPSISPTFLKLDIAGLFTYKAGIVVVIMSIFTLVMSDLFDTIGTFIGTGKKAGIFKVDKNNDMPYNLEKALVCDSVSTIIGSMLGTSNITTYVESSIGIEEGGRTGLTAVSAGICFGLSLFLAPLVACVPMAAIAPILIFVGLSMIENIIRIDWKDILVAIPAFFIIVMMPLSYSITTGIQFGFIFYVLVNLVNKKGKDVSFIIYLFTILFIIDFVYRAFN